MNVKYLFMLIAPFAISVSYAQFSVMSLPDNSQLACPGNPVEYKVNPTSSDVTLCSVQWTIKTGVGNFESGSTASSNPTRVIWPDQGSNKVSMEAIVRYYRRNSGSCTSPETMTLTFTTILRSVFGRTLTGVVTPRVIPYCSTSPIVNITVDAMYISNTGGFNPVSTQTPVERYEWVLPAGWKLSGTTTTGTLYTSASNISIEPTNPGGVCTVDGQLKVRAFAGGFTACVGTAFSTSYQSTIALNRSPALTLTPQAGFTGQTCGKTTPVTLTASSISCATSYSWAYTGGWTGPALTSTNSVTLTPVNAAGTVTVTANTPTCSLSKAYAIPYDPNIPKPNAYANNPFSEWCNGESFNFTVDPLAGYPLNFGYDFYASSTHTTPGNSGVSLNGNINTSLTNPLHTTASGVTVSFPSNVYDVNTLSARMNNGTCLSAWVPVSKRVGTYDNQDFNITGYSSVCAGQAADFGSSLIGPDITNYQWSAPNGWSNSGQGTPHFHVSVPSPFFGGAITLRLQNRCGLTNTPYVLNLSNSCFGFSASPNPASKTLEVTDLDPSQNASAALVNDNSTNVKKATSIDGKITIDVSDLPNGLYFLVVTQNENSHKKQIVIKH